MPHKTIKLCMIIITTHLNSQIIKLKWLVVSEIILNICSSCLMSAFDYPKDNPLTTYYNLRSSNNPSFRDNCGQKKAHFIRGRDH